MKTVFLEIEYIGTRYCGFQLQNKPHKNEITVQGVLEAAIEKLFRIPIRVDYTSRTDAGVHARAQGISFPVETKILPENIKRALNRYLPGDIRVKKVKFYPVGWRVRHAVAHKTYRYAICNKDEQSVFEREFSWHVCRPLDIAAMRKAAAQLIGKKDFTAFAKDAKSYKSCVREVRAIEIKGRAGFIHVDITAAGFLRNMARNMVNFLVDAGLKKTGPYCPKPAPAQGLRLYKTVYKRERPC